MPLFYHEIAQSGKIAKIKRISFNYQRWSQRIASSTTSNYCLSKIPVSVKSICCPAIPEVQSDNPHKRAK